MDAAESVAARLIGSLLVERGLATESQVQLALAIQQETDQQLGEILVERFGVSRAEIAKVIAEQWQERGRPIGPETEAALGESWRRLGEIFVARGLVTEAALDQALKRQRQTGERLGEALVALGAISRFELDGALAAQMAGIDEPRAASAVEAPTGTVVALPTRPEPPATDLGAATAIEDAPPEPHPELRLVEPPEAADTGEFETDSP